jgi:tetratricopeptide (TPR) repeat protein
MARLIGLLIGVLVATLAGRAAAQQPWAPPSPPADAPADLKAVAQQADALYAAREKPGNMDAVLSLLREAGKKYPASYDIQWRLSRALFWVAEVATPNSRHESLATEGQAAGQRAVAAKPNGPEGLYFGSINIGEISHAVGILAALTRGLEGQFRDPLYATEKIEPGIDNGGLYNALGRYKYELPWPKRDLDASAKYLRKAMEVFPPDLRARVYLAETLAARDHGGDTDEAKKLLKEVLDAPVGRYDMAEELRVKDFAHAAIARLRWDIH